MSSEVGNVAGRNATTRADTQGSERALQSERREGGTTMNPYLMEKIVEHNRTELARSRQKRDWRTLFRLSEA
jgi:hypothetical protein